MRHDPSATSPAVLLAALNAAGLQASLRGARQQVGCYGKAWPHMGWNVCGNGPNRRVETGSVGWTQACLIFIKTFFGTCMQA